MGTSGDGERVALVTGAAQGIGRAVANALLEAGMRVALLDRRHDGAAAAALSLDPAGERTIALGADVADPAAIDAAIDELGSAWRLPDVLVNNAAATVSRSIWDITVREWDEVLATNLRSCLLFSQRCGPAMRDARWGRIVNMASLAGQQGGVVAGAHYASSKAGIIVLTKIVARELAGSGVTVNAVSPAAIRTPAMDAMDPQRIAGLASTIPVGRVGTSEEVGALVAYLCSPSAAFITGATLDINGGLLMR
jgi:3-oxoacyl-[acyl-carrier protein] reductase